MKPRLYPALLCVLLPLSALLAQVKGVSYTIAPSVSYNWFNDDSGLDDAFMIGGRVGFGFGEYVELRATYLQTINQSTDFAGLDVGLDSSFLNSNVDLARYGAELKLNVGRGSLLPYLLVGGGIQDLERQGLSNAQNIFGTAGVGLTLSAADRYTLGVEGKYIAYSFNAVQNLLDDAERAVNNIDLNEFDGDQVGTYSVAANLQFYLGGRRPGQLSDVDEEYRRAFQGGVRGLSLPVELGFARVKWDDGLPYRDAYFLGGSAGFNFGPLISLRGFYYRGMEDDDLNFDFDNISLYGGDFRFNLSTAKTGIAPFLSLGGGYIDLGNGYNDGITEASERASSQGFASGGGGVNLKFGDRFTLNGGVRALLTSGTDFDEINTTEQLRTSLMYNAGLKFVLGGSNSTPEVIRTSEMQDRLAAQQKDFEERADSLRLENKREVQELREKYEARIAELDKELNDALAAGDTESATEIKQERKQAREVVDEIEIRQQELELEEMMAEQDKLDREQRELDVALGRTPQDVRIDRDGEVRIERELRIEREEPRDYYGRDGRDRNGPTDYREKYFQSEMDRRFDKLNYRLDRLEDMLNRSGNSVNSAPAAPQKNNPDEDPRIRELEERLRQLQQSQQQMQERMADPKDERIRELERQIEQLQQPGSDAKNQPRGKNKGGTDKGNSATDDRIRQLEADLQRQLEELRTRVRDNRNDDQADDNPRDDRQGSLDAELDRREEAMRRDLDRELRLREMESRLMGRLNELENGGATTGGGNDEERLRLAREQFTRDMADYQSETIAEIEELKSELAAANRKLERRAERERNAEIDEARDEARAARREARRAARLARENAPAAVGEGAPTAPARNRRGINELDIDRGGEFLAEPGAQEGFFTNVAYTGMSGIAGLNLGDASFVNLGLRWHYSVGSAQRVEFMPEAYIGLGRPTTFGIFGNALFPVLRKEESTLRPYVGAGVGIMQIEDKDETEESKVSPALNLILGTYLPVAGGRFFVDYSIRNFFQNSQLAGGYRFNF